MQLATIKSEKIAASAFLVAGGAGFIGSHIAEFLLNAGARKVRVLDNLSTGHFRNVAPFANHPAFEFIVGDINDIDTCKAVCKEMDYVFHEAINDIDVTGFLNILVAAQTAGVKRFVYAVQNKLINELYAGVFANNYGIETIGLRYFNVYGQRQCPQSEYAAIIPRLVMQLMRHESPAIDEPVDYAGDLTYVEDVVQANMLAVLTTDPRAVNQVFDIAGEEKISFHQLAICLKEYLGVFDKSIADVEIALKDHNICTRHAGGIDKRAQELLGFQPHYSLWNGLLKSISWYWSYWPQFEMDKKKAVPAIHGTAFDH
jgi:UDP-N-acetylglucosamine 4-epimerase